MSPRSYFYLQLDKPQNDQTIRIMESDIADTKLYLLYFSRNPESLNLLVNEGNEYQDVNKSLEGPGEVHKASASGDESFATQDSSTDFTPEENSTVSSVRNWISAGGSKLRDCIYKALGVNYYIHVLFRELIK